MADAAGGVADRTDESPAERLGERCTARLGGLSSPHSKLVYLYLRLVSEAHVSDIRDRLSIDFLTLYPVLDSLVTRGLVERDGMRYRCCS